MTEHEQHAELPPPTVSAALRWLTRRLAAAGVEGPERDARRLLAAAADLEPHRLIADPDAPLSETARARLAVYADRRVRREPVSRILGHREFWGREFRIDPATLDPRADSETLIETALSLVRDGGDMDRPLRILDVGTGTGCLLLTLLAELPHATGLGTDLSEPALAIAAANARTLGLAARATFRRADLVDGVAETFDLVVSNPPYIPRAEIDRLAPEVRDHDPRLALDGGEDGLDVYRHLAADLPRAVPAGMVVLEVGAGQAADVMAIFAERAPGVRSLPPRLDLGGHARCVIFATR